MLVGVPCEIVTEILSYLSIRDVVVLAQTSRMDRTFLNNLGLLSGEFRKPASVDDTNTILIKRFTATGGVYFTFFPTFLIYMSKTTRVNRMFLVSCYNMLDERDAVAYLVNRLCHKTTLSNVLRFPINLAWDFYIIYTLQSVCTSPYVNRIAIHSLPVIIHCGTLIQGSSSLLLKVLLGKTKQPLRLSLKGKLHPHLRDVIPVHHAAEMERQTLSEIAACHANLGSTWIESQKEFSTSTVALGRVLLAVNVPLMQLCLRNYAFQDMGSGGLTDAQSLTQFLKQCPVFQSLQFDNVFFSSGRDLFELLVVVVHKIDDLRLKNIVSGTRVPHDMKSYIILKGSNLKTLHLQNLEAHDTEQPDSHLIRCETLVMRGVVRASAITQSLCSMPKLHHLDLSECILDVRALSNLGTWLSSKNICQIRSLKLQHNLLTPIFPFPYVALSRNTTLRLLNLDNNSLGTTGLTRLLNHLPASLHTLSVRNNNICIVLYTITSIVPTYPALTEVDVRDNITLDTKSKAGWMTVSRTRIRF